MLVRNEDLVLSNEFPRMFIWFLEIEIFYGKAEGLFVKITNYF